MKAWLISIYIFCTIALLAVLCALFPADGIRAGGIHFEFPSVAEVLTPAEADNASSKNPLDFLKDQEAELQKLQAQRQASNAKYEEALRRNPTAICFPGGDYKILDSFFAACDSVKRHGGRIRVVHFGDSQIEIDHISGPLRERLQQQFGGCGVGIQPLVQTVVKTTVTQRCSPEPSRYMLFGDKSLRTSTGHYGPMAQSSMVWGGTTVMYNLHRVGDVEVRSAICNRCKVLLGEMKSASVCLTVNGQSRQVPNNHGIYQAIDFSLPDSTRSVRVGIEGNVEVLGVMLDGDHGVAVDNIPMRGCSGAIFQNISRGQLEPFLRDEDVRLILLEYGGNVLAASMTEDQKNIYCHKMAETIRYMKQLAPSASVVFIGPSDMATRINGEMQTYPMLEPLVSGLKKACASSGAGYWDLYRVMGGHNSMVQWVQADPALAYRDYTHFTPAGADRVGELLYQSLMLSYDYYKTRIRK